MWKGLIKEYKEWLPVTSSTPDVSLLEGNTPLVPLVHFSKEWNIDLHVKLEGANPTGSFKDRGMVMAVAKAKEEGSNAIICASTGNTSASAAAYGARAGLRTIVVIPDGRIALGKLAQAKMYGADIVSIEGNFDEALTLVRRISEEDNITLVNSVNPFRLEGQKTAALEVLQQLGKVPDLLALPVGNAGNISAYWKGFSEYQDKYGGARPVLLGVQAEGAAPIVMNQIVEQPETIATAIRIGHPASWKLALNALKESSGDILSVSDEEILETYHLLARKEGIFAEPASCASIAGLKKRIEAGLIQEGSTVVAVLTGNGLKDPETAINTSNLEPVKIKANINDLRAELKGGVKV
ncbi:threonine synthase [Jeotgalibacillus campisalis]|uniref:Threonine synthase n=1 Tax=Jeotgalibacillus campisalis TaxID=220754 RepID=A0A0C2VTW3_9BACL|nr:threonine synthase [Jeotgalibacillus campisalis]KIL47866.1 threonine synthase [Jeotgalibacillus campisalis]